MILDEFFGLLVWSVIEFITFGKITRKTGLTKSTGSKRILIVLITFTVLLMVFLFAYKMAVQE